MNSQGKDVIGDVEPMFVYQFAFLWTSGRLKGGRKHQYRCGWGDWGKLPMII